MPFRRLRGFTLFEVLVAFAILAVALAAVSRATLMATDNTSSLRDRQLALWIAENRAAWYRATLALPVYGEHAGTEMQADTRFVWTEKVSATPNRTIRRVAIAVRTEDQPAGYALANLTIFVGER